MKESAIEKYLVACIRSLGGRAYKWVSPGNDGVPDRIVLLPGGRVIFVELKTERGKLTELQEAQIIRIRKLGQQVRVLYGLQQVKDFIDEEGRLHDGAGV